MIAWVAACGCSWQLGHQFLICPSHNRNTAESCPRFCRDTIVYIGATRSCRHIHVSMTMIEQACMACHLIHLMADGVGSTKKTDTGNYRAFGGICKRSALVGIVFLVCFPSSLLVQSNGIFFGIRTSCVCISGDGFNRRMGSATQRK